MSLRSIRSTAIAVASGSSALRWLSPSLIACRGRFTGEGVSRVLASLLKRLTARPSKARARNTHVVEFVFLSTSPRHFDIAACTDTYFAALLALLWAPQCRRLARGRALSLLTLFPALVPLLVTSTFRISETTFPRRVSLFQAVNCLLGFRTQGLPRQLFLLSL